METGTDGTKAKTTEGKHMKICHFCKGVINEKTEKYNAVEDWEREEMKNKIWAHLNCFKRAMNRDLTELEKQAAAMLSQAGRVLNSDSFNEMFPKKEVYNVI